MTHQNKPGGGKRIHSDCTDGWKCMHYFENISLFVKAMITMMSVSLCTIEIDCACNSLNNMAVQKAPVLYVSLRCEVCVRKATFTDVQNTKATLRNQTNLLLPSQMFRGHRAPVKRDLICSALTNRTCPGGHNCSCPLFKKIRIIKKKKKRKKAGQRCILGYAGP